MSRLVSTSRELETLNANLEQTIEERTKTLQRTFDELRASEEARVLSDERHRIMADMHDGVGGQLVSALTILRSDENANADAVASLEFALDDLRSVIDSMNVSPNDLFSLLDLVRARFEPSMNARGIELRWQVGELRGPKDFNPEHALNLMRILQECFTNALKHSEASQISLKANEDNDGKLTIDVRDNGKGFDTAGRRGRGMGNLERRANAIAATLQIKSHTKGDDRGTHIRKRNPACLLFAIALLSSSCGSSKDAPVHTLEVTPGSAILVGNGDSIVFEARIVDAEGNVVSDTTGRDVGIEPLGCGRNQCSR